MQTRTHTLLQPNDRVRPLVSILISQRERQSSRHLDHLLDLALQLRFRADGVDELVGPEVADLGDDGGNGAEEGAGDGHEAVVDGVAAPGAVREAALHAVPQAGALHLVLARAHAQLVVALVQE